LERDNSTGKTSDKVLVIRISSFIRVASFIAITVGILGIILCFTVITLYSQGRLESYPMLQDAFNGISNEAFPIGTLAITLSIMHIFAGGWLLVFDKIGGVLGSVVAVADIFVFGLVLYSPAIWPFLTGVMVVGFIMVICLRTGWDSLE
jgi:hypothetical protein